MSKSNDRLDEKFESTVLLVKILAYSVGAARRHAVWRTLPQHDAEHLHVT